MNNEQLKECLVCPVCLEDFKDPRILNCGHSLCSSCCRHLLRGTVLNCPVCRHRGKYPCDNARHLPKNITLGQICEAANAFQLKINPALNCESCGKCFDTSVLFICDDCKTVVCALCNIRNHKLCPNNDDFDMVMAYQRNQTLQRLEQTKSQIVQLKKANEDFSLIKLIIGESSCFVQRSLENVETEMNEFQFRTQVQLGCPETTYNDLKTLNEGIDEIGERLESIVVSFNESKKIVGSFDPRVIDLKDQETNTDDTWLDEALKQPMVRKNYCGSGSKSKDCLSSCQNINIWRPKKQPLKIRSLNN